SCESEQADLPACAFLTFLSIYWFLARRSAYGALGEPVYRHCMVDETVAPRFMKSFHLVSIVVSYIWLMWQQFSPGCGVIPGISDSRSYAKSVTGTLASRANPAPATGCTRHRGRVIRV